MVVVQCRWVIERFCLHSNSRTKRCDKCNGNVLKWFIVNYFGLHRHVFVSWNNNTMKGTTSYNYLGVSGYMNINYSYTASCWLTFVNWFIIAPKCFHKMPLLPHIYKINILHKIALNPHSRSKCDPQKRPLRSKLFIVWMERQGWSCIFMFSW